MKEEPVKSCESYALEVLGVPVKIGIAKKTFPCNKKIIFESHLYKVTRDKNTEYVYFKDLGAILSYSLLREGVKKYYISLKNELSDRDIAKILNLVFVLISYKKGFISLHASGVLYKGQGLVFAGPSESGKTTIAKLLQACGAKIINDDIIALRKKGKKELEISSFPCYTFNRNDRKQFSALKPEELKALFFLHKSRSNKVLRTGKEDALYKAAYNLLVPLWIKEAKISGLLFLSDLIKTIPCYDLYFSKNTEFISLIDECMRNGKN